MVLDRSLRKARPFLTDAQGALREADVATHALDVAMIEGYVAEARRGIEGAEGVVEGYYAQMRWRPRIVVGVWVFVLVNVGLFWWKRRDLERG